MIKPENPFTVSVVNLTDKRILKIVMSPKDFSPKLVDACRTEIKNRGIENLINKELAEEKKPNYLFIVRKNLSNGASFEDCKTYLSNERLDEEIIISIIDKARGMAPFEAKSVNLEPEYKGPSIWIIFLVMFTLIRLIFSLAL